LKLIYEFNSKRLEALSAKLPAKRQFLKKGNTMYKGTIIGLDLAKTKFHIFAITQEGEKILHKKLHRDDLVEFIVRNFEEGSLVAMEACSGCHFWGQRFETLGFKVALFKARDVKAFATLRQKNDINDAQAITKAARDPELRRVSLKTVEEQKLFFIHKLRDNCIKNRVKISNSLLGMLHEFGFAPTMKKATFAKYSKAYIDLAFEEKYIDEEIRELLLIESEQIDALLEKEKEFDARIKDMNKKCDKAQRLLSIQGIGPLNASILSSLPMESYSCAKEFAASLGLVPSQNTTGGKIQLGRITKRGNRYCRKLLIQAARTVLLMASKSTTAQTSLIKWARKLLSRKGFNKAAVAVANKLARIAYACCRDKKFYQLKTA
jgi:transposase